GKGEQGGEEGGSRNADSKDSCISGYIEELNLLLTCPTCHEILVDPVSLPCSGSHVFCRECITGWLENKLDCPTCRQEVALSYLKDIKKDPKKHLRKGGNAVGPGRVDTLAGGSSNSGGGGSFMRGSS
ncbi:unnamed protein product, partial [Discosporangium mesarthrocarpum]